MFVLSDESAWLIPIHCPCDQLDDIDGLTFFNVLFVCVLFQFVLLIFFELDKMLSSSFGTVHHSVVVLGSPKTVPFQ